MIYTIEKRHEFGYGSMETHYEVISHTHITKIGVYANPQTVERFKTKREARKYCADNNIEYTERLM